MIAIKSTNDIPFDSPLRSLEFSDIKPKFIRNKTYDLATTVTRKVTLDTGAPVFEKVTLTPNPVDCGKTFVISVKVTD